MCLKELRDHMNTLRTACDSAQIGTGNPHSTAALKSLLQYQSARSKYPIRILFQVNICFRILVVQFFFLNERGEGYPYLTFLTRSDSVL